MFSVIGAILAIGILIVVHEAGHFVVARWCKMRVDRFSVGFGPAVVKWRSGGTDFTLGPIPFGGFVQISGMMVADDVDPEDEQSYPNRPVWQRFLTIFAGPATNYVFAVLLAFFLYLIVGVPSGTSYWAVGGVAKDSPAAAALKPGDRIVAVDGTPIYVKLDGSIQEKSLTDYVVAAGETSMNLTVLRDDKEIALDITPELNDTWSTGSYVRALAVHVREGHSEFQGEPYPKYLLGIALREDAEHVRLGGFVAAQQAAYFPVAQTRMIATDLYRVATREQEGEVAGVVGITRVFKQAFDVGWVRVIKLLMLLNVYLGLINLLPLPALDGGRLVFLAYEMATRRRANPKIEATVHMVGITALLLLMVVVTYNDIAKWIGGS